MRAAPGDADRYAISHFTDAIQDYRVLSTAIRFSTSGSVSHQVLAIAQFEKASTVAKLKAARDRKRAAVGQCEGRRSHLEMKPELVGHRSNSANLANRKSFKHQKIS
jgi:hypothetical protein